LAGQNSFGVPTIYTTTALVNGLINGLGQLGELARSTNRVGSTDTAVTEQANGGVVTEVTNGAHSAMCLRLIRLFPRVMRGMRRYQDQTTPQTPAPLGPRHVAALEQLRDGPLTVGTLATRLDLTLSTVSGVLAGLDQAGFVDRSPDEADRRRIIAAITPAARPVVEEWLDGAAAPLARVLDRLDPDERTAFLKAMDMLEAEFRGGAGGCPSAAAGPLSP
jgi:DNA-binding MarR family transcriptional regulator